ncbi:hypothetical protein BC567DRAFT_220060 [Phyllosticta citribraziliensis]
MEFLCKALEDPVSSGPRFVNGLPRNDWFPAHHGELRQVEDRHVDVGLWRLGLLANGVEVGGAVARGQRVPRVAAVQPLVLVDQVRQRLWPRLSLARRRLVRGSRKVLGEQDGFVPPVWVGVALLQGIVDAHCYAMGLVSWPWSLVEAEWEQILLGKRFRYAQCTFGFMPPEGWPLSNGHIYMGNMQDLVDGWNCEEGLAVEDVWISSY